MHQNLRNSFYLSTKYDLLNRKSLIQIIELPLITLIQPFLTTNQAQNKNKKIDKILNLKRKRNQQNPTMFSLKIISSTTQTRTHKHKKKKTHKLIYELKRIKNTYLIEQKSNENQNKRLYKMYEKKKGNFCEIK